MMLLHLSSRAKRGICCSVLVVLPMLNTGAQAPSDSVRAAFDRSFAMWTGTEGPGCSVGVARNGELQFARGYGMANLETDTPNRPASIFHVASVSKQFTAMSIMLLARDGKLSLDDDVRKYIPELPDYGKRITIRHILQHTSGLRDQWDLLYLARGRFEEDRVTEQDVMEIIPRQRALNFDPGSEYLYSNTGYTLAGVIVKRVSGKSLRDFADERIFRPLGMTNTHFHDDYTMVVRGRTSAYARGDDGKWHVSIPNYDTYGATSLYSDVGDLLKWEHNLDAPVVGDRAIVDEMQKSGILTNGENTGYGLGLQTETYRGARLIGHGGADAGYRTYIGRFPEQHLELAVLCNAATANPSLHARQVADAFLGNALPPVANATVAQQATLTAAELSAKSGVFAHAVTGDVLWLSVGNGQLVRGRAGRGPSLVALDANTFSTPNGAVRVVFAPDGRSFEQRSATRTDRYVRQTPSMLRGAELAKYAGTYYSEELGASYTVTATDSTLLLRTRMGDANTIRPAFGDTFDGDLRITFTRDGKGKVNGMTMATGRVRGVKFITTK